MTNFGATLKKARESKGISLDQIAKATRISTRFLAAIENEEFALLPGGVFNKGFVRAFAEHVGVDPDQAVAEYERLVTVREPIEDVAPVAAAPAKSERHLYPIALGILAIAIAIFYIVTRDTGRTANTPNTAPAAAPAVPAQPTPPVTIPEPSPAPAPVTSPAATPPEPLPPPPVAQALRLDIEVRETTWIKITSDGNAVIAGEILEPGTTRKFTAENSIQISIGNAAGLALKVNDMPLKPLGKSGQVRSVTITPANLKDFIG